MRLCRATCKNDVEAVVNRARTHRTTWRCRKSEAFKIQDCGAGQTSLPGLPGPAVGPQGAENRPKARGRISHFILPTVCPGIAATLRSAQGDPRLLSSPRPSRVGDASGTSGEVLRSAVYNLGRSIGHILGNSNLNLCFGFGPCSYQTWPQAPFKQVGLENWCRTHLKSAPETNSNNIS